MDGILIINKPQGMTSHDVVDFLRNRFSIKKVGHAGTLDPMATGVLVMLVGSYTKTSGQFIKDDKEYCGEMVLGATSDTGDAWGKLSESEKSGSEFKKDAIEAVFKLFTGPMQQFPPAYSAVKYKGKKLYELARKGITVKMSPRDVRIEKLDIMDIALPKIKFMVECSKGTYIRQLCVDIGAKLGCGAFLSQLNRTRSGIFRVEGAIGLEELKKMGREELRGRLLL